jgi:hypothetical protein
MDSSRAKFTLLHVFTGFPILGQPNKSVSSGFGVNLLGRSDPRCDVSKKAVRAIFRIGEWAERGMTLTQKF